MFGIFQTFSDCLYIFVAVSIYGDKKMNMKKKIVISGLVILTVILAGTLIGVAYLLENGQQNTNDEKNNETTLVEIGTIQYVDLEGGFYGILSDDGNQYLPVLLAEEYQQDGLRIRFSAEPAEDQFSIHMWGVLVELVEIELLD